MNIVKFKSGKETFEGFDKLFNWKDLSDVAFNFDKTFGFTPKSEIVEDKDNFYISVELPGVARRCENQS